MMMSRVDVPISAAECGRAATSQMNEVVQQPSHRAIAGPVNQARNCVGKDHAAWACPHSNPVPSTQMQWKMTAIFRATATLALFMPSPGVTVS